MKFSTIYTSAVAIALAEAATSPSNAVATPSPIQSGMTTDCNRFYKANPGDTCQSIVDKENISLDDFYQWNPAVGNTCSTLFASYYVCTGVSGSSPTTLATVKVSATSSATGVTTPTPIQSGTTKDCKKFYKAVPGDTCKSIADKENISLDDFYSWNPAVGSTCSTLFASYYVCVGI